MHQGLMIHYLLVKRKTHQLSSVTAKGLPLKRERHIQFGGVIGNRRHSIQRYVDVRSSTHLKDGVSDVKFGGTGAASIEWEQHVYE